LHGNGTLRRLLCDRLPAQTFEDLAVPFECVAASIERAREHWFQKGDLIEPVLASCALPRVFPTGAHRRRALLRRWPGEQHPLDRAVARGAETIWVLHVGRLEEELAPPRFLWEVTFTAFEISRRYRFHSDLERVGSHITVHVLPSGLPPRPAASWSNLRYGDTRLHRGTPSWPRTRPANISRRCDDCAAPERDSAANDRPHGRCIGLGPATFGRRRFGGTGESADQNAHP
jgi:NTE family protein